MEGFYPRVVKQLGRSRDRRIFNPDAISGPDVQEQLPADAFALQLRCSALPFREFTPGSGIGEEPIFLKPPEVQSRTILDSMSKFDGALDTC